MAENRYRKYLEDQSSRYSERLQQAQDNQSSPMNKVGIGIGLGFAVGATLFTRPGQRLMSAIARHLPDNEEMGTVERTILNRHYGMQELRQNLLSKARRESALEYFGNNATIRDALVDITTSNRKNIPQMFLSAAKAPDELVNTIMSTAGRGLNMSREELTYEVRRSVTLSRDRSRELAAQINKFRTIYDENMLERYALKQESWRNKLGLRPLTVGDVTSGDVRGFDFTKEAHFKGLRKVESGEHAYQENILKALVKKDRRFENLLVSPGLFTNDARELVDLRNIHNLGKKAIEFSSEFHLPFVGISPYDVLGLGKIRDKNSMPLMHIFKEGEPQFIFDVTKGLSNKEIVGNLGLWKLKEDMVFIGNKVYNLEGNIVAKNMGLAPSQWGRASKIYTEAAGLVGDPVDYAARQARRGKSAKWLDALDIGNQESHSIIDKFWNAGHKFKNKSWVGNFISQIASPGDNRELISATEGLKDFIHYDTRALSDVTFDRLFGDDAKRLFGEGFDLSDERGIMDAFEMMVTQRSDQLSDKFGKDLRKQWAAYAKNPYKFMESRRAYSNKWPDVTMLGDFLSSTTTVGKSDDLKKLIQQEVMAQVQTITNESPLGIAEQIILKDAGIDAKGMALDFSMSYMSVDDIQTQLQNKFSLFNRAATGYMDKRAPWFSYGPMPLTGKKVLADSLRGSYLMVREGQGIDVKAIVKALNGSEQSRAEASEMLKGFFGQFFAGRNNMDRFTKASMAIYNTPFGRIQEALSYLHLGLGPEHTGSAGSLFGNMILRRYLPTMLGVGVAGYLSFEMGNLLGIEGDQLFADVKENIREGYATTRDALGITSIFKKAQRLMPGSEMMGELPFLHFLDPSKSYDDVKTEAEGDRPIRKGRWWMLGNTPFIGGKVLYYLPSEQRLARADYRMTGSLYGSEEEYYKNAWFPTPRYPLAPIRHFVTDPYHYEKKHYYDRPYPYTGPISEFQEIPIAGSFVSGTLGRVFKPTKAMHQEEMRSAAKEQIAKINRSEMDRSTSNYYAYITPSSELELVADAGPSAGTSGDIPTGGRAANLGYRILPTKRRDSRGSGKTAVRNLNSSAIAQASDKSSALNNRILVQTEYHDNPKGTIKGTRKTDSLSYGAAQAYYGFTEMSGLKGFLMRSVTGQPLDNMKLIQDSGRMTSYNRAFWDLELGGMGGEGSEIGRRFIPRQRRFQEELDVNPIPNNMPSWMPGDNYFINFRRGDPYQKIARGEARLPGGGYEALYGYHPEDMAVRASQVGKNPTEILDFLLNRKTGSLPGDVQDAMEQGTEIHRQYQSAWRKQGILISAEQEIYDEETKSTGHYDAIIRTTKGPQVVDIKTVSQKRYDEVLSQNKPFEEHLDQVTIYQHALGLKNGGIFYVNRDTGEETFYPMKYDKRRHRRLVEKLNAIRTQIRQMMNSGQVSPYELYDPLHRFLILADVAPYSDEYKYYKKYVTKEYESLTGTTGPDRVEKEQAKELIGKTKKRVTEMRKEHRFFPYRFKDVDLAKQQVHITDVLKNGMFLTAEFPGTPIQFGGIGISDAKDADEVRNYLSKYIRPGAKVTIGIDKDEGERISKNYLGTMKAVIYHGNKNLNLDMMKAGLAKEKPKDWSAVGVHARFSPTEIFVGHMWESFAHMDTPFHSKFLPVKSPLEEYKRKDVYGKNFQQWSFRDQVIPTIQSIMSKDVFSATLSGGLLGGLVFGKTLERKMLGAGWGAAIFAALSIARQGYETFSGHRWIPKRRWIERDINEYFDILEYVKYKGLFEYAARESKKQGFDVYAFLDELDRKREATKREREAIETEKKSLVPKEMRRRAEALKKYEHDLDKVKTKRERVIHGIKENKYRALEASDHRFSYIRKYTPKPLQWIVDRSRSETAARIKYKYGGEEIKARDFYDDALKFKHYYQKSHRLRELNKRLGEIGQNKELIKLPPWAIKAMQYRQHYQETLYGAGSDTGIANVMGSLPKKEREYFAEFIKAKPEEREEILELVPQNERRFLQMAWGMKQDKQISLREYFKTHYLPKANWEGWSDKKDLQDIKIKVIKNEGQDLSEFGFWKQDSEKAEANNAPAVPIASSRKGQNLERNLHATLKGLGLTEVDIKIEPLQLPGTQMDVEITKDRRQEMIDFVNENLDTLL